MGPILIVIVVLGGAFLLVTAYMEWIGFLSIVTPRSASRYDGCGHIKALPGASRQHDCWACRHSHLRHPLQSMHLHHRG